MPTNTRPFFWEIEANLEPPEKLSPYIGIYYNFVLKSVKSLNRIFWIMEHWFKALEWQIWFMIKKHFFRSRRNLWALQKLSPCIGVSFKKFFEVFEKPKSNILSYWILVQSFPFFWEIDANLQIPQKHFPFIEVSYQFVLKSDQFEFYESSNICSSLESAKFVRRIQNHFSRKARLTLEVFKVFKSLNSLNQIFSVDECWFKAL